MERTAAISREEVVVLNPATARVIRPGGIGDMSREGFGLLTTYSMTRFTTRR